MWLARALPPLVSRLRRPAASAHRGGSLLLASTSSRAYTSPSPADGATWPQLCDCCGANQLQNRRRNLYVVLDDWEKGFSLYRLSLEDLIGDGDDSGVMEPRRLPDPILRLSFRAVGSRPRLHAVGSNIVATSSRDRYLHDNENSSGTTVVCDMDTAAIEIENSLPTELEFQYDAIAAGDRLYAFHTLGGDGPLVHCLRRTEPTRPIGIRQLLGDDDSDDSEEEDLPHGSRPQPRWAWERIPAPVPFGRNFGLGDVQHSRALHPDGRTAFVSVGTSRFITAEQEGTFSLDTTTGEWTRLGDWNLPFKGLAHYDGDLDALVGTRTVYSKEDGCGYEHLCTCDVPAPQGGATPEPAWMVAKEKLTFLDPSMKPVLGYRLIRIGGMFCLMESAVRQGFKYRNFMGDGDKCLLRLTMFRAKYTRNGELVAAPLRPSRSYLVSRYVLDFHPFALWV